MFESVDTTPSLYEHVSPPREVNGRVQVRKKRVLYFLSDGRIGGQERAVYQLLSAFRKSDEVEMGIAIDWDHGYYIDKIKELRIPIILLNLKSGFSLKFDPAVLRQLRAYDIHHLPDPSPNQVLYSLLAGRGIRRVFTRRGGMQLPPSQLGLKRTLKFWLQRALLKRFMDGFSGNTRNAAASVRTQYGVSDREIFVLYNGIDFSLLDPILPPEQIRVLHGVIASDFVVGTACRLVGLKRVDMLIRAFARCRIANKKLLIFGDGPLRRELENLVKMLGLESAVRFAGMVPEMKEHYQILDCFVLASTEAESFGNAVVEAMYAKVPAIIMADSSGLKEHIDHQKTGFIARDELDLTNQIENIAQDRSAAREVGARASVHVVNKYSLEKMTQEYTRFYRFVCGESNL